MKNLVTCTTIVNVGHWCCFLGCLGCVVCLLPRLVSLLSNVVAIMINILARQMWLMLGLVMVG